MEVRHAGPEDIPEILEMYRHARQIMRESGNPGQWNSLYPGEEDVLSDLACGNCYICEEQGKAVGTFAFIVGEEPTYHFIEEGNWGSGAVYGTIHRLASNGRAKGVGMACFAYCREQIPYLRADTHEDNHIMRKLLSRFGFRRCGIIYVHGHSQRLAYEYMRV